MRDRFMNYVECEAPAELTLAEWRRARVAVAARRRSWLGPLRPLRRAPALRHPSRGGSEATLAGR